MKCPYCAAEMDPAALVCKACDHDLFFLRPLLERCRALEQRLDAVETGLAAVVEAVEAGRHRIRKFGFRWVYALDAVVAGVLGSAAYAYFAQHPGQIFLWISILIPIPAGILLGLAWPGRHLSAYLLLGLLLGVINLAGVAWAAAQSGGGGLGPVPILAYVVGGVVMFTASGALGDWFEQLRSVRPVPSSVCGPLVSRLVAATGFGGGARRDEWVQGITTVLAAAVPIIGVIGSVLNALLLHR